MKYNHKKLPLIIIAFFAGSMVSVSQFYPAGGYQGGGYGNGGDQTLDVEVLDLKVFLAGCYAPGAMAASLNSQNLLPLDQPYDSDPMADWYYTGDESVDSIPNDSVADWIVIELRETAAGPSTARQDSTISTRAAFIITDGSITDLDGISELRFKYAKSTDNTHAVIKHRNHLSVMNAVPLGIVDEVRSYDFTDNMAKAYHESGYTNNDPMMGLPDGFFGLWPGNARPDKVVKYDGPQNDREEILNLLGTFMPSEVIEGYYPGDIDMNGKVRYMGENNDKIKIYLILGHNTLDSLKTHTPD
jgi:hypothetical protein